MLCPCLPRLAGSVVVVNTLLVAFARSLQLLVYIYFAVATMPHLSEALTFYHILSHGDFLVYK